MSSYKEYNSGVTKEDSLADIQFQCVNSSLHNLPHEKLNLLGIIIFHTKEKLKSFNGKGVTKQRNLPQIDVPYSQTRKKSKITLSSFAQRLHISGLPSFNSFGSHIILPNSIIITLLRDCFDYHPTKTPKSFFG